VEFSMTFDEYWQKNGTHIAKQMIDYAALCIAAERERIADWLASQRNDTPATGQEFARALRSQENRPLTSPLDGGDKS
jgi:hypothetical protein